MGPAIRPGGTDHREGPAVDVAAEAFTGQTREQGVGTQGWRCSAGERAPLNRIKLIYVHQSPIFVGEFREFPGVQPRSCPRCPAAFLLAAASPALAIAAAIDSRVKLATFMPQLCPTNPASVTSRSSSM